MARKLMDFSSQGVARLELPNRPISPWLRLAHFWEAPAARRLDRAPKREILDFEMVLQLSGSSWIGFDTVPLPGRSESHADATGEIIGCLDVPAGSLSFIPPRFPHAWATESGTHIAVHFDLHARPGLRAFRNIRVLEGSMAYHPTDAMPRFALAVGKEEELVLPLVTKTRRPRIWRERLENLVRLWQQGAPRTADAQFQAVEILCWAMNTMAEDAAVAGLVQPQGAGDPRILELLGELETRSGGRPSVTELARRAGMGQTAFRAAFRRTTGKGPREYLEGRRVEYAARALLETHRTIVEIARLMGYDDPYHFSRVFKRVVGESPRAYRRRMRGRG